MIDKARIDALKKSLERVELEKKGNLDLKKPALIKAMQGGNVIPQSLHVWECGQSVGFFYKDSVRGVLLNASGVQKCFKYPRREIEKIREKAGV